jgi:hypothetical protein
VLAFLVLSSGEKKVPPKEKTLPAIRVLMFKDLTGIVLPVKSISVMQHPIGKLAICGQQSSPREERLMTVVEI